MLTCTDIAHSTAKLGYGSYGSPSCTQGGGFA